MSSNTTSPLYNVTKVRTLPSRPTSKSAAWRLSEDARRILHLRQRGGQRIRTPYKNYNIQKPIVKEFVAAVSAGIISDQPNLDLDYNEDSLAQVDANFIICESGKIAEIQVTGEEYFFSDEQFQLIFNSISIQFQLYFNSISNQFQFNFNFNFNSISIQFQLQFQCNFNSISNPISI